MARVEVNEVNEVKRVAVKAVMAEAVEAVGSATEVTVEAAMAETMEVMTALETAVGMAAEYTALNRVLDGGSSTSRSCGYCESHHFNEKQ